MKTHSLVAFTRAAVLGAIACGCGADPSDDAEPYGMTTTEFAAWADSLFMQTLRVDPGSTNVRNRCEMRLRLQSAKPLTFIASESTALGPTTKVSVGWTGSAVSSSGLTVSACTAPGCTVTATWLGTTTNGTEVACQMIADDGVSQIIGDSSGNSIAVPPGPAGPSSSVIFLQQVQTESPGTARTGTCLLRKNGNVGNSEVAGFSVFRNGFKEVDLPDAISLAGTWPTSGPAVDFGRISVGTDSVGARLRHVAPRKEQLAEGDALRCAGTLSQGIVSAFSVNMGAEPAGDGMSLTTEPTGWNCVPPKAFGTGNGCDCDCGVMDPDCGTHDCTHLTVTFSASAFTYAIDGVILPVLNLTKGRTYVFDVNTAGHPFALHQAPFQPQGARYTDGVVGVQPLTSGQLKFTPPLTAPPAVYYQCEVHLPMSNTINLANP